MKAFSHLCKNVTISLMYDTITLYFKPSEVTPRYRLNLYFKGYVYREDRDHYRYHQDNFDISKKHYHLQFFKPVNELQFDSVLTAFIDSKMISQEEKTELLQAYRQANSLEVELINPTPEEQNFNRQLLDLYFKACEHHYKFEKNHALNYENAAKAAKKLYTRLYAAMTEYSKNKTPVSYDRFRKKCKRAIALAKPELEQHRGLKQIIGNILLCIALLGIGYVGAGLINLTINGQFLFFQTDSMNKIANMSASIERIPSPLFRQETIKLKT